MDGDCRFCAFFTNNFQAYKVITSRRCQPPSYCRETSLGATLNWNFNTPQKKSSACGKQADDNVFGRLACLPTEEREACLPTEEREAGLLTERREVSHSLPNWRLTNPSPLSASPNIHLPSTSTDRHRMVFVTYPK